MPGSNTFPVTGTYRGSCGHIHEFGKGSPFIACPECGGGDSWEWVDGEISPATGLHQIDWPGGMLTLLHVGVPPVSEGTSDEIMGAMQDFSRDCQMMATWFAGILGSREVMRQHLSNLAARGEPFKITTLRPDVRVAAILAQVPVEEVIKSTAEAGAFERLYANSFVVFTFHLWEEVTRPRIAAAMKVCDYYNRSFRLTSGLFFTGCNQANPHSLVKTL